MMCRQRIYDAIANDPYELEALERSIERTKWRTTVSVAVPGQAAAPAVSRPDSNGQSVLPPPSVGQIPEGVQEEEVELEGLPLGHGDMALDEMQPEEGANAGLDDSQGTEVDIEESSGDEDDAEVVEVPVGLAEAVSSGRL